MHTRRDKSLNPAAYKAKPKPVTVKKHVTRAITSAVKLETDSMSTVAKTLPKNVGQTSGKSTAANEVLKEHPAKRYRSKRPVKDNNVLVKKVRLEVSASGQKGTPKQPKPKLPKKKKVRYGMDCSDVNDIDIIDFQNYLLINMRVAKIKNNKCLKVKIVRRRTIIVKSSIYVAKKSLRSVTNQYLNKKKIKAHVRCESPDTYKLISNAN